MVVFEFLRLELFELVKLDGEIYPLVLCSIEDDLTGQLGLQVSLFNEIQAISISFLQ